MVTVVKRPTGHKLIDQAIAAEIIEDYVGDAVVQFPYHSLTTGDTVYIESDIDEYNGFWYVTEVDANQFKISEHSLADFVEYYQDADIDYYQTQPHDWSSIFLPIVYKIKTDRWPINEIDTARTILSNSNDNGFTQLTLSGDIKSSGGGINALEFIKITGGTSSINGVWQIVEVFSNSDITIDLPYDSTNSFSGVVIQYYYSNYQIKVKIYAGLDALHPWEPKKPYEEVAELSLTPDEDNEVMFSVSDYIQMKVQIKNNTLLYSLPLNLDAFTGFYISTSESFDDSDGYSLSTTEQDFVDDSFEGYAVAGKLPFKNLYAGDYGRYVYTSGSPAEWLTTLTNLLAVNGLYFDVSFIKNLTGDFFLRITKYFTDDYSVVEDVQYTDQGIGVYRIPLTIDSTYERYCIHVWRSAIPGTPGTPETEDLLEDFPTMDEWFNQGTGGDWIISTTPSYASVGITNSKEYRSNTFSVGLYPFVAGESYRMVATYTKVYSSGGEAIRELKLSANDNVGAPLFQTIHNPATGNTTGEVELIFVATSAVKGAELQYNNDSGDDFVVTIDTFEVYHIIPAVPPGPAQDAFVITEEICIDIIDSCESLDQFVSEGIRLLEDGGYRLLE